MLNSFRARSNCEVEAKFIQDRIGSIEKNVAELCHAFAQYSRKAARLRDKGDEIAKIATNIAENENINHSLNVGLENFADSMTAVSDYGDVRAHLIDKKVTNEFSKYEDICKHVKDEVRVIYSARDREINRKKQLDRIREKNPRNRQQIVQAETELVKASAEVTKSVHHLEEKVTTFEKQKIHDIKTILLDFISTEMGYHAKILEILTKSYRDINNIDEESDLEEFKKSLRVPDKIQYKSPKRPLFRSAYSMGSLGAIFSTTHNKRTPGIPDDSKPYSKSQETLDSMKHSISDSDDESGSDDDDEASEIVSDSDDKMSPIVVKKFTKY